MTGILPTRERDAANNRLRREATRVLALRQELKAAWKLGNLRHEQQLSQKLAVTVGELDWAWRMFPECERDKTVPKPQAILRLCRDYERQKEEQERLAGKVGG